MQGIGFGDGAFDPWDVDAALLLVDILALEQRHFGGPQPVMIGELKQGAITLARDDGKQPAHLVLGEEGDLGWWVASWRGFMSPTVYLFCRITAIGLQEYARTG